MADLSTQLEAMAASHDREAGMLDNEFPEPDDYCSHAGGDSARATAVMLRRAAAICKAAEEHEENRGKHPRPTDCRALDAAVTAGRDKETP